MRRFVSAVRLCAWLLVGAAPWAGCAVGTTSLGEAPLAPTFDGLPSLTNEPNLAVSGTRPFDAAIVAVIADSSKQTLVAASLSTRWQGVLNLQEGNNTLYLQAVMPNGFTINSNTYGIVLDTIAPTMPAIDSAYNGAVFVYDDGTGAPLFLTGQKDRDASVTINGNQIAGIDGQTTWSFELPSFVDAGSLTVTVTSSDLAGNISSANIATVQPTQVPPLSLDTPLSFAAFTNQSPQTIRGSKTTGDSLFVIFNGGAAERLGSDGDGRFSYTADLASTNAQDAYIDTVLYQTDGNQQSPFVVATIHYDIIKPQPPSLGLGATKTRVIDLSKTIILGQPGDGSQALLQLVGATMSQDSNVCVATASLGPCQADLSGVNLRSGNFTMTFAVKNGPSQLFVTSRDGAGNISDETTLSLYVLSQPAISISQPSLGQIIEGNSTIAVAGTIKPAQSDLNAQDTDVSSAAEISDMKICIDNYLCCDGALDYLGANNGYTFTGTIYGTANLSPTQHTLSATASNGTQVSYAGPGVGSQAAYEFVYDNGLPTWLNQNDGAIVGASNPQMVQDMSGNLHVVWQDLCVNGTGCSVSPASNGNRVGPDIFYARRNAMGVWDTTPTLISSTTQDGHSQFPVIDIDGAGMIHIAWADDGQIAQNGRQNRGSVTWLSGIVHRGMDANSRALGAIDALSQGAGVADDTPSLAGGFYNGSALMHLSWRRATSSVRNDIMYARWALTARGISVNSNQTFGNFSSVWTVTQNANTGLAAAASTASWSNGLALVAWQECRGNGCLQATPDNEIYFNAVASSNGPDTSGPILVTSDSADLTALHPSIDVGNSGQIYVVWSGKSSEGGASNGFYNIFLRSYDGGTPTSSAYTYVSRNSTADAQTPRLKFSNNNQQFAVAWAQATTAGQAHNSDIWATMGYDLGNGFRLNANIPSVFVDGGASMAPDVVVTDDTSAPLAVVWTDYSTLGTPPFVLNPAPQPNTTQPAVFFKRVPAF